MAFFGWGPNAINSGSTAAGTRGPQSNPDTTTLLAEVDFNGTNASARAGGMPVGVTWIVGAQTTNVTFLLEQSQSTNLDMSASTTFRQSITVEVSSGQSAQFFTKHSVNAQDRFRIRINSSFTGAANGYISVEPLV